MSSYRVTLVASGAVARGYNSKLDCNILMAVPDARNVVLRGLLHANAKPANDISTST